MILSIILFLNLAHGWTSHEMDLYKDRRFLELQLHLRLKQKIKMAEKIELQQIALLGCKEIYSSAAKSSSFALCTDFLNREQSLGIKNVNNKELIEDLNLLCVKNSVEQDYVKNLLARKINLKDNRWDSCRQALWKQVYLTVYANLSADPLNMAALVRKAKLYLGSNKTWEQKIISLTQSH